MMRKGMKKGFALSIAVAFTLNSVVPNSTILLSAEEEQGAQSIEVSTESETEVFESGELNLFEQSTAMVNGDSIGSEVEITLPDGTIETSSELKEGEWAIVDGEVMSVTEALELLEASEEVITEQVEEEVADIEELQSTIVGGFTIIGGELGTDYTYASNVVTILTETHLTFSNTTYSTATADRITIPAGVSAYITLDNVNMSNSTSSGITLTPSTSGGASLHITLADGSVNTVTSTALRYPGIRSGETTTLVIDDSRLNQDGNGNPITPYMGRMPYDATLMDGTFIEEGGRITLMDSANPGQLNVKGGTRASCLGGAEGEDGGYITFEGGIISALQSYGSTANNNYCGTGIGGGYYGAGGNIVINGGKINASGSYHGAGIGGSWSNNGTPNAVVPAAVNTVASPAKSGNITVNGGLSYSTGGEHGDAFGDGCTGVASSEVFEIKVTGGTLIPQILASNRNHLGGGNADVYVIGGSFYATAFGSRSGSVVYGDLEKETQVIMTTINLEGYGKEKVETTLVEDMSMTIDGLDYEYGAPSYTDAEGKLYFWLSDAKKGAEVAVDLTIQNKEDPDVLIDTDTFFATNVGMPGASETLKQYINFEIEEGGIPKEHVTKRYDGIPLDSDCVVEDIAELEIWAKNPETGYLDDAKAITLGTQPVDANNNTIENTEIVEGFNANAGRYQLIITSTQYAEEEGFSDAFWGHRATYAPAIIYEATVEISANTSCGEFEEVEEEEENSTFSIANIFNLFKSAEVIDDAADTEYGIGDPVILEAFVQASSVEDELEGTQVEAKTCAAPEGYVQFYVGGEAYGKPVELEATDVISDSGYNQSVASISWVGVQNGHNTNEENITVSAEYVNNDVNYSNEPDVELAPFSLTSLNADIDGDGIPDINIDTTGDGIPDVNVDTTGDLKPNVNIDTDGTGEWKPSSEGGNGDGIRSPDTSIDTNGDGIGDYNSKYPALDLDGDGVDDNWNPSIAVDSDTENWGKDWLGDYGYATGNPDINMDIDGDGIPDINIDTTGDGKADLFVDVDADYLPDVNIDTNGDGNPDVNVDTTGDYVPNINIDTDGTGEWKPSSEGGNYDGIWSPDKNIDVNGDGIGDYDSQYSGLDNNGDGVDDNWKPGIDVNKDTTENWGEDWLNDFQYDTANPDINMDIDGDGIPDINIDTTGDGIPDVNVDTTGDYIPNINIDTDGTGEWKPSSEGGNKDGIWSPDTDLDTTGDGLPNANTTTPAVDLDGDGVSDWWKPEGNDVTGNGSMSQVPNLDIDKDGIPDVNIDTNGDYVPDVNVDTTGDLVPNINIDTDLSGQWKPSSEGGNSDGVWKPDTSVDINGDGKGDYNSNYPAVDTEGNGVDDNWKPGIHVDKDADYWEEDWNNDFVYDTAHPDVDRDLDGDGIPDINVDTTGDGKPNINIDVDGDGIPDINIDTNGDGIADVNVDTTGDYIPNINIDTDGTGEWKPSNEGGNTDGIWKPDTAVDTDGDGIGDYNSPYPPYDFDGDGVDDNWKPGTTVGDDKDGYTTAHPDLNMDTTGDGVADLNIDTDGDGVADVNIDTDGDGNPDLNIDVDGDGVADVDIDTNGDGTADLNIDLDGDGIPDINIDTTGDRNPDLNIDLDGDGIPDVNIDTTGDGKPDLNIDVDGDRIPDINIDTNGDGIADEYILDEDYRGTIDEDRNIYDEDGNYIGRIDEDGIVYDAYDNIIGTLHENNYIYDLDGVIVGYVDEDGKLYGIDGTLDEYLQVAEVEEEIESVNTSDNTNSVLYLMLAIMSLSVMLFQRKRTK